MSEKKLSADQVPPGGGGGGGGSSGDLIQVPVVSATGGLFTTSSATFVDVTGVASTFTLPVQRKVKVTVQFTGQRDASDTDISAFVALQADGGADQPVGDWKLSLSGGFNGDWIFTPTWIFDLPAGAHTVKLRAKSDGAHNIRIKSDANSPSSIFVEYFDPTIAGIGGSPVAFQDAILSTKIVSDKPDFLSLPAGLTIRLLASGGDPFIYSIGSALVNLTSNVDVAAVNNAHNFVWADTAGVTGVSLFPPLYSFAPPGGPATDQHWFDLGKNLMKRWNGSAWVAVGRIFIGYVRADSGALNARYVCEAIGLTPMERFSKFGNGSDGFLDVSAGTTTINGSKHYTAIVIRGAGVIKHTARGLLPLEIQSQSIVAPIGTSGIDLKGLGLLGGIHLGGGNVPGQGGGLGGAGGNTSGGASLNIMDGSLSGSPGGVSPNITLEPTRTIDRGYGNGGASNAGTNAGNGGNGGGYMKLKSPVICVGATALIRSDGDAGTNGAGNEGGGGGGGGGILALIYRHLINSGSITVGGGAGGTAPIGPAGTPGGAGAILQAAA